MTDRHAGYIVTLGDDIREDDAEFTLNAIRMVKGVTKVKPIVSDFELHLAEMRVKTEVEEKFLDFLRETFRS